MYISSVFYFHDIAANVGRVCIFIRECNFSVYVLPARRVTIEVKGGHIEKTELEFTVSCVAIN